MKYCCECGQKSSEKVIAYLLPFRACMACGHIVGAFALPYMLLLAPLEAIFGKGEITLMVYSEGMSYFTAVKIYLSGKR